MQDTRRGLKDQKEKLTIENRERSIRRRVLSRAKVKTKASPDK